MRPLPASCFPPRPALQARHAGRELRPWMPGADDVDHDLPDHVDLSLGLEEEVRSMGRRTAWDQFALNERKFGVQTSYQEEIYTVKLDPTKAGISEAEAARLAAEIEGSTTTNVHLAEERGQMVPDDGLDEEDKYGAVVRGPQQPSRPWGDRSATLERLGVQQQQAAAAAQQQAGYGGRVGGRGGAYPGGRVGAARGPVMPPMGGMPMPSMGQMTAQMTNTALEAMALNTQQQPRPAAMQSVEPAKPESADASVKPAAEASQSDAAVDKPKPKFKFNANAKAFALKADAPEFVPGKSSLPDSVKAGECVGPQRLAGQHGWGLGDGLTRLHASAS